MVWLVFPCFEKIHCFHFNLTFVSNCKNNLYIYKLFCKPEITCEPAIQCLLKDTSVKLEFLVAVRK